MKHSIKPFLLASSFGFLLTLSQPCLADAEQMNATLARISTILSQINPLINAAEKEQNTDARVKFQFDILRADISKIQAGIAEKMHGISIQPRNVEPLSGDYLDSQDNGDKR